MNDDWATGLLSDPDLGPEPLSTVDAMRAVYEGRRRARARRVTAGAAVATGTALAVAAVPAVLAARDRGGQPHTLASASPTSSPSPGPRPVPPRPPTRCAPSFLPLPAGFTSAVVLGGEPSGRYLVGSASAGERVRTVLWDNGRLAEVPLPPGAGGPTRLVVNADGVLAATSGTVNWVYRAGAFVTLANPGGGYSVTDINVRGDVLGNASGRPPLVWAAGAPERPRELAGGTGSVVASAIDDDGTVAGHSYDPVTTSGPPARPTAPPWESERPRNRPLYWSPDGVVHELPMPPGHGPNGSVFTIGAGVVVGSAQPQVRQNFDPVVTWDLRTGKVTIIERLTHVVGAINRHGWMAGRGNEFAPAALYGDTLVPLPVPPEVGIDGSGPWTISDDGRTIAGALMTSTTGENDRELPIRWLCS